MAAARRDQPAACAAACSNSSRLCRPRCVRQLRVRNFLAPLKCVSRTPLPTMSTPPRTRLIPAMVERLEVRAAVLRVRHDSAGGIARRGVGQRVALRGSAPRRLRPPQTCVTCFSIGDRASSRRSLALGRRRSRSAVGLRIAAERRRIAPRRWPPPTPTASSARSSPASSFGPLAQHLARRADAEPQRVCELDADAHELGAGRVGARGARGARARVRSSSCGSTRSSPRRHRRGVGAAAGDDGGAARRRRRRGAAAHRADAGRCGGGGGGGGAAAGAGRRRTRRALAYEVDEERKAPAVADGVVPLASWWSDREVSRYAPPGGAPRRVVPQAAAVRGAEARAAERRRRRRSRG